VTDAGPLFGSLIAIMPSESQFAATMAWAL